MKSVHKQQSYDILGLFSGFQFICVCSMIFCNYWILNIGKTLKDKGPKGQVCEAQILPFLSSDRPPLVSQSSNKRVPIT